MKTTWELSNEIELEAKKLCILTCDKAGDNIALRKHLARALSTIKGCQDRIEMEQMSLQWAAER